MISPVTASSYKLASTLIPPVTSEATTVIVKVCVVSSVPSFTVKLIEVAITSPDAGVPDKTPVSASNDSHERPPGTVADIVNMSSSTSVAVNV